jgi:hypothetical protein
MFNRAVALNPEFVATHSGLADYNLVYPIASR